MRALVLAALVLVTACSQHNGPRPAACTPATAPPPKSATDTEARYRFMIARACVDRAALDLSHTYPARQMVLGSEAIAACASEVRDALVAREGDAVESHMFDSEVPYSGESWRSYAQTRVNTFTSGECS